jgi:hypothetical protein
MVGPGRSCPLHHPYDVQGTETYESTQGQFSNTNVKRVKARGEEKTDLPEMKNGIKE